MEVQILTAETEGPPLSTFSLIGVDIVEALDDNEGWMRLLRTLLVLRSAVGGKSFERIQVGALSRGVKNNNPDIPSED